MYCPEDERTLASEYFFSGLPCLRIPGSKGVGFGAGTRLRFALLGLNDATAVGAESPASRPPGGVDGSEGVFCSATAGSAVPGEESVSAALTAGSGWSRPACFSTDAIEVGADAAGSGLGRERLARASGAADGVGGRLGRRLGRFGSRGRNRGIRLALAARQRGHHDHNQDPRSRSQLRRQPEPSFCGQTGEWEAPGSSGFSHCGEGDLRGPGTFIVPVGPIAGEASSCASDFSIIVPGAAGRKPAGGRSMSVRGAGCDSAWRRPVTSFLGLGRNRFDHRLGDGPWRTGCRFDQRRLRTGREAPHGLPFRVAWATVQSSFFGNVPRRTGNRLNQGFGSGVGLFRWCLSEVFQGVAARTPWLVNGRAPVANDVEGEFCNRGMRDVSWPCALVRSRLPACRPIFRRPGT